MKNTKPTAPSVPIRRRRELQIQKAKELLRSLKPIAARQEGFNFYRLEDFAND